MDIKLPLERLVHLDDEMDPLYAKVQEMMSTEGNRSYSYPKFKIRNIYAQKYKRKGYNFDMDNQHAMFLRTTRHRLVDEIVNGVEMIEYKIGDAKNYGACVTDYFNFAASNMYDPHELIAYVPIAAVALGNIHVCNSWQDLNPEMAIPKGCDSTWLRGIFGHTEFSTLNFSNQRYTVHVGAYQINKHRLHPLLNSMYIVGKKSQVEIIMLVEADVIV